VILGTVVMQLAGYDYPTPNYSAIYALRFNRGRFELRCIALFD
jgi:hypothetical protein